MISEKDTSLLILVIAFSNKLLGGLNEALDGNDRNIIPHLSRKNSLICPLIPLGFMIISSSYFKDEIRLIFLLSEEIL